MSDIFISYSSKDRAQAEQLTELLASAGLSVWIDQSGIDVATSWSKEIVQGIDGCKAFVILLSPSSVTSVNVAKEISLAAEQRKKILPLDLEPVELTDDLRYHLAGLQRTPMTNIDAIIRALGKLGLEATRAPTIHLVKEIDGRKSLMILPFEDLSPTGDNAWFADGIVSEMISALSNVKALKIIDWNTSRMFKERKVKTVELAKEFSVRYFIEGQVRKFGDQIKISVNLLDIETGDHLWQSSLKGTMGDIFDIQETVAKKVVEGLAVILTADEVKKLDKKPTENAEAYELALKGQEYFTRQSKSDLDRALMLYEEAILLDPNFVGVHAEIATVCIAKYLAYERSPALLKRIADAAEEVKRIEGMSATYYCIMSSLSLSQGDAEGALTYAQQSVQIDPEYFGGYSTLGSAFGVLGRKEEMVKAQQENMGLRVNSPAAHFGLIMGLHELGDINKVQSAVAKAKPIIERHIRLNPDDYLMQSNFALILSYSGNFPQALSNADNLSEIESIDAIVLYNLACLYTICNVPSRGMECLRRAVAKGFSGVESFHRDSDLAPLHGMPEFERLKKELEEKIAKEKNG